MLGIFGARLFTGCQPVLSICARSGTCHEISSTAHMQCHYVLASCARFILAFICDSLNSSHARGSSSCSQRKSDILAPTLRRAESHPSCSTKHFNSGPLMASSLPWRPRRRASSSSLLQRGVPSSSAAGVAGESTTERRIRCPRRCRWPSSMPRARAASETSLLCRETRGRKAANSSSSSSSSSSVSLPFASLALIRGTTGASLDEVVDVAAGEGGVIRVSGYSSSNQIGRAHV